MTLTEAIKHCKEVAEEKKKSAEAWSDVTKRGTVGWTDDDFRKVETNIKKYKKCEEEHWQLAEWLEDYERIREKKGHWHDFQGHWYDLGSLSCRCSKCGCKNNRATKFCPNCGVRMEGVE